jgi:hypothetical protein
MNVEIGTEAALFLFWEYINGILVAECLTDETRSKIFMFFFIHEQLN